MKIKITQRDTEVLKWIEKLKYLSTSLIAKFFFNGKVKVARRRLKYLADAGYLLWFEKSEIKSCGRLERVFLLNKKNNKEIKCLLGENHIRFFSLPKNPLFVNHDLEVSNFILSLKKCCDKNNEYSFDCISGSESETLRKNRNEQSDEGEHGDPTGLPFIGRNKASFIPDALLVLQSKQIKSLCFLEVDTGKEVISGSFRNTADVSRKMKAYIDYLSNKGYQRLSNKCKYEFKGFRVLFVTTLGRINRIKELCEKCDTKGVVWITSFENITPDSLFDPIWQVPCSGKDELLAIVKKN